ncbi:MAG: TetR/AcrR family transcriptional regulator [Firmicutes bacterium]|nr:TetR/AcrR family transcriptional regulator [Bacillota bacterium]
MTDLLREFTPKEIKILDAAVALMAENTSAIGSLKVADIAAYAGIGKGTVYEYFSSKEEILREAIIRFVIIRVEEEWAKAFAKPSFKECVYCAMEEIFEPADGFCIWDLQLLSVLDGATAEDVFMAVKEYCLTRMGEMCKQMLNRGAEEGLFPETSVDKGGQAFVHLFSGLSLFVRVGNKADYKTYMDCGYEMLIKSLQ